MNTIIPAYSNESAQLVDKTNKSNDETNTKEKATGSSIQTDAHNTFNNTLIKLVMPTSKHRTKEFTSLLDTLFQTNLTLNVNWGGPSDDLLGLCRILAAGCHHGDPSSKKFYQQEIITAQDSERIVSSQLAHNQQMIFAKIQKVARTLAVKDGTDVGNNDELSSAQLFKAFQAGPISKENEEGAMVLLYFALGSVSLSFHSGINANVEGYHNAVAVNEFGEAASHLYAQSKKMLVTHGIKTLATRLNLQNTVCDTLNHLDNI